MVWKVKYVSNAVMPLNPDEAANDEWKTYHDEGFGRDEGHDLNDIKGDLVNEDDEDEIRQPYQVSKILEKIRLNLLMVLTLA